MTHSTMRLEGPNGIYAILDPSVIDYDDPGSGTPAMVYTKHGRRSATFWCAQGEGEIDDHVLTPREARWLDEVVEPEVDAMYEQDRIDRGGVA